MVHKLTYFGKKTGSRGGVTQVRVEFMDDQSRSIIRNVKGPGMESFIFPRVEGKRDRLTSSNSPPG